MTGVKAVKGTGMAVMEVKAADDKEVTVTTAEKAVVTGRAVLPVPFQTPPSCGGLTRSKVVPTPPHPTPAVALPPMATQIPFVAWGVELH